MQMDELPHWDALASTEDARVPLLATALLIANDEYLQLDVHACMEVVEEHARRLRDAIDRIDSAPLKMLAVNRYLFEELGYGGDNDDYDDPRNSYLNQVLARRLGNPISLALVQMEVARRLGLPLEGISFPGHFLVRLPVDDGMLVMDPFNNGRPLDIDELRERAKPHLGGDAPDDDALRHILHPASHRGMLMRILRNLHAAYSEREDWERAVRCADRILKLSPTNAQALRDRGLGYLRLGHQRGAREDLSRYVQLNPRADDVAQLRERLIEANSGRPQLH